VRLDGQQIANEGVFIMDKDRSLEVTCERKLLWRYPTPSSVYYTSLVFGDDGTIYFGTGLFSTNQGWAAGTVYAMNPDSSLKWSRDLGQPAYSPAIGQNGNIYVMEPKYIIHAFSPAGSVLWTFDDYDFPGFYKRDMGQRIPAIGTDGTIYIGGDGLYALDPLTGTKRWHVPHHRYPSRECMASPVIGEDGTIYNHW
jgi:outer membrane protein assembly factor BamB